MILNQEHSVTYFTKNTESIFPTILYVTKKKDNENKQKYLVLI